MGSRTKIGRFIHSTWINLNIRCCNGKYFSYRTVSKNRSYESVYIKFTREEFKNFCIENREDILQLSRPSIDRINNNDDYSLENIQFIELADNISKDKLKEINGIVVCCSCGIPKPLEDLAKDKRKRNGRSTICRRCDSLRKRIRSSEGEA